MIPVASAMKKFSVRSFYEFLSNYWSFDRKEWERKTRACVCRLRIPYSSPKRLLIRFFGDLYLQNEAEYRENLLTFCPSSSDPADFIDMLHAVREIGTYMYSSILNYFFYWECLIKTITKYIFLYLYYLKLQFIIHRWAWRGDCGTMVFIRARLTFLHYFEKNENFHLLATNSRIFSIFKFILF